MKFCAGCDGAGDFDIEHNLAVGAVGVAGGIVAAAADRNGGDGWRGGEIELVPVGGEIGLGVTSAEFDESDTLAGSIDTGGEVVEGGDLRGREGCGGCGVSAGSRTPPTKMRFGLRAIVETEDAFDDAVEFLARRRTTRRFITASILLLSCLGQLRIGKGGDHAPSI